MKDLIPAAQIAIIGGADGPTSIYIGKAAILQSLYYSCCPFLLFPCKKHS